MKLTTGTDPSVEKLKVCKHMEVSCVFLSVKIKKTSYGSNVYFAPLKINT
jgi:hypothetical protein